MSFETAIESFGRPLPAGASRGEAIHFCNAYSVALAETNERFRNVLAQADVVTCDGVPITWAGRLLYGGAGLVWDRVYGPDVMTAVLRQGGAHGARHYFLGGSEQTLAALLERVRGGEFLGAQVAGAESPPFRELTQGELQAQVGRIKASGATHVWVGLGQPKQDFATAFLANELVAKAFAVGAAFDFLAGVKSQAPIWMQRSGTEWFFRLITEPKRLTKRYFWGNPMFVYSVAKEQIVRSS
jgi:N-acetylglucosaminyldiphosphoundecaprenol N-acetyl-beta-D-mannosaminyltransferase